MTYATGTATSLADFVTQLFTFATGTPGWTQDQLSTGTGQAAIHKGNTYVSFRWDTGTPLVLGMYQALGYTGGNQPGQHPNDSGYGSVGSTNATIINGRCVNDLGNGASMPYYFFGTGSYIHAVVQKATGVYRHLGFGVMDKVGDWTGGEYCYGQFFTVGGGATVATNHTALLDGLMSGGTRIRCATVHAEGLTGEPGASKWMECSDFTSAPGNDTAGNAVILGSGGHRGGPIARHFGCYFGGNTNGLVPMYPIGVFYRRISTSDAYFLGYQPDVRGVNIHFINETDEITIGSDVWKFFPMSQKTLSVVNDRSYYAGIAYKKIP